jgi:hypothetical protein
VKVSPKEEAKHLLKFAENRLVKRENVITALIWEALRFVYFSGQMPEFWKLTAEKQRPSTSRRKTDFDFILLHPQFPIPWCELQPKERKQIIRIIVGNQTKGARILDASEAIQSPVLAHFTEWCEKHIETIDEGGSIAPKRFRREDGGVELVMVINPHYGWHHIANSLKRELKGVGVTQYGRSNKNDIQENVTKLRGLAGLWLGRASMSEPQRNKIIYPTQGKRADYRLLRGAEKKANELIGDLIARLNAACSEWTAAKAEAVRVDDERIARIEKGFRRQKRRG